MNNLELLFAQYKNNMDRMNELSNQSLEKHDEESGKQWYAKWKREKDEIYLENEILLKQFTDILEQPFSEVTAVSLYDLAFQMYQEDYDDSQFLMNIFTKLEEYYEKKKDMLKLIPLYVAHSYELNAVQQRHASIELMDVSYLEKVITYKECYREMDETCRLLFWKAIYNYIIVGMDRGNWTMEQVYALYEEYLDFFEENKDFDGDITKPQFQGFEALYKKNIAFSVLGIHEGKPETTLKFQKYMDHIYQKEIAEKGDDYQLNDAVYAGHLYSLYLKGEENLDGVFDKYCDYYQYRDQKMQAKDITTPDDLYFYSSSIRFLTNVATHGINPEKINKLMGLFSVLSERQWNIEDSKMLLQVIDLTRSLSTAIITFSTSGEEIENCYERLNVRRNILSYVHSKHVSILSGMIFEEVYAKKPALFSQYQDMSYEELKTYIEKCGLFHDLGSIATSFLHIYAHRPLMKEELNLIYSHPLAGAIHVEQVKEMAKYIDVMLGHHKSFDGKTGFPVDYDNTVAENKVIVDLVHIADAIDLRYDEVLSHSADQDFPALLNELEIGSGTIYHPEMVSVILSNEELQTRIRDEIEDTFEFLKEYYRMAEEVVVHQSMDEFLTQVNEKYMQCYRKGEFQDFLPLLDRLFAISAKEYSDYLLGIAYYYSMMVHSAKNEYTESINAGLECVKYLDGTEEYAKCCLAYNVIGTMMETTGSLDNGLGYYLLSYEKAKKCHPSNLPILRACNNIANLMKNVGQYERAIYYYSIAEEIELDDSMIIVPMLCNVLYCHIEMRNGEKIEEYKEKISKLIQNNEYPVFLVHIYFAYLEEYYGNYERMDEHIQKALADSDYYNEYIEYIDEIHLYLNLLEKMERYEELDERISFYLDHFSKTEISYREYQSLLQQRARCAKKRKDMDRLLATLDLLEENIQAEHLTVSKNIVEQENSFLVNIERQTKQKQILKEKERLEVEVKEAWDANKAKSAFLSSMSHEIRTPIHAILGLDEMILRESKDEAILDYAKDIENAGKTLLGIINDVLDFSKMEAGKLEIIPEKYDCAEMILDLRNMIGPRAKEKGLEFHVHCEEDVPRSLYGDSLRLKQVIINILTNAVKYTTEGSIDFHISNEKTGEKETKLRIAVKDTGMGMREEDLEKLYRPFERIEEKKNRGIEGTGLGMSIVTSLVKQMHGTLEVKSEYRKGSEFIVTIPQEVISWEGVGSIFERKKNSGRKSTALFTAPKAEILVVDDNAVNIKVVTSLLKRTEMQVTTAMSGQQCIDVCRERKFDLILLDHRMPEMDGVETLDYMRKNQILSTDTTVIALTANAISGAFDYYMSVGFQDLLTKPVNVTEMEKKIMMYLPAHLVNKR